MKLKYYIRGIGTGIIIATTILSFTNKYTVNKNGENKVENKTQGSIIAYTKSSSENENKQIEETSSDIDEKTTQTEIVTQTETKTQTETTTQIETLMQTETHTDATTQEIVSGDSEYVTVVFENINFASDAVNILYDAKVITDKEEFLNYLIESGNAYILKDGEHILKKGDSYENICTVLTTPK